MKMKTYINPNTEKVKHQARKKLSELLSDAKNEKVSVLLLLSGGSSLGILDGNWTDVLGSHLTIAMLDERYATDPKINNFSQFMQTDLYKTCLEKGVSIVDTRVYSEKLDEYTKNYDNAIKAWFEKNGDGRIIATVGIGSNGHVAGILPFLEDFEYFEKTFVQTSKFIAGYNTKGKDEYKYRVTSTLPLLKKINEVVTFAVGENKKDPLTKLFENSHPLNELPVQILNELENLYLYTDQRI